VNTLGALSADFVIISCTLSLLQVIEALPLERTRVCLATFDSSIHFYDLRPLTPGPATPSDGAYHEVAAADVSTVRPLLSKRPKMMVVTDIDDPFCALSAPATTVPLADCKDRLLGLLRSIPGDFAATQTGNACGSAAIKAAVEGLKAGGGGRVIAFMASLPRTGALALQLRDGGRPLTDRDPLEVMLPASAEYSALASDAAENQITVDLHLLATHYIDAATLGTLTSGTYGDLRLYPTFSAAADTDQLRADLHRALVSRPQGLEAVGRLRVSTGLAVDRYSGHLLRRDPTDLAFPSITSDHAVAAVIAHDHRLPEGSTACFQFALLYTTFEGQRRVRVHTLALPTTRSMGQTFKGADLDVAVLYAARRVAGQVAGRQLAACKEALQKASVDILAAYRKQCAAGSPSGQLILPESLKLLPLRTLALTKSPCFRTDARPDVRAVWLHRITTVPPAALAPLLHPRLLPLHGLDGLPEGRVLPDCLWLSSEKLDPAGAYLLENGFEAYIWVGRVAPPEVEAALLSPAKAASPDGPPPTKPGRQQQQQQQQLGPPEPLSSLPPPTTQLGRAAHALLAEVRRQRGAHMRLRIIRRGDPEEGAFLSMLVEDRSPVGGMSYAEALCHVHRLIQNRLA
jgi:protein transport protein SEC24